MRTRPGWAAIAALSLPLAGCGSEGPAAPSHAPTRLSGEYLLRLELSPSCAAIPVRGFEWGGEAFPGAEGTVFRVPSLDAPNDPTEDHVRLVLVAGAGGEIQGELRLNRAQAPLPAAGSGFASVLTDGLAGVAGQVTSGSGGRPEVRGARLTGTVVVEWLALGSGQSASCAYADHRLSLVP